jgi:hypothetical protein
VRAAYAVLQDGAATQIENLYVIVIVHIFYIGTIAAL